MARREGGEASSWGGEPSVESSTDSVGCGFGPVGAAGLSQYVFHMVGDRVEADDQFLSDFLVALTAGQQTNHLDLPGS